jgi:hypothetical protein
VRTKQVLVVISKYASQTLEEVGGLRGRWTLTLVKEKFHKLPQEKQEFVTKTGISVRSLKCFNDR